MTARLFALAAPLLARLEAETAHRLTLAALRTGLVRGPALAPDARLRVRAFGLDFPNPVGLAAGFDKNAEVHAALSRLGFGFVEVGTVTPEPQEGNPRPRLFRLPEDRAVINRMGFNNQGHAAVLRRLDRKLGIVGVNIGANKDSTDRAADYALGVAAFAGVASYIVVNVSSPNTPGLRGLQSRGELDGLLDRLARVRKPGGPPLLLKIAPDLSQGELADVAEIARGRIDGFIVSNTTISRPALRSARASQAGGLSGAPLFEVSTRQLARLYLLTKGEVPLIGAGGIADVDTAWAKIRAGASLIQLYTGLIYRGPALIGEILAGLPRQLEAGGHASLADAVGGEAERWAYQGLAGT